MEKDKPREPELNFKPLTSGLGFHPFADGLPYAPITKSTPTNKSAPSKSRVSQVFAGPNAPAGASAAGAPRIARAPAPAPARPAPRVSVPVAAPAPAIPYRPAIPGIMKVSPAASTLARPATLGAPILPAVGTDLLGVGEEYGLTYLIKRMLAYGVDSTVNLVLVAGAMIASLWNQGMSTDLMVNPGVFLTVLLFLTAFNWAVITAQEVAFGTSLGKRMFGLAIEGSASLIFLRSLFFLISAGFCGVGLFWAVANPRKRCWHDLIVDIQPVEIAQI